jgi:hypothetical protein
VRAFIAARAAYRNALGRRVGARPQSADSAANQLKRWPRGAVGKRLHPSEMQLGKLQMRHRRFDGNRFASAVEFFERTIGMM